MGVMFRAIPGYILFWPIRLVPGDILDGSIRLEAGTGNLAVYSFGEMPRAGIGHDHVERGESRR